MEKGHSAAAALKPKKTWLIHTLWIACTVLIVLVLVPVFSLIWRDRTNTHTRQECEVIADALLRQSASDKDAMTEWVKSLREQNCFRNALAAWICIYGGADSEEIAKVYDDVDMPAGVAYIRGKDDYHVLLGEFPREEFDAALKAREGLEGPWGYTEKEGDEPVEHSGLLDGYAAMNVIGDVWYYSNSLKLSDVTVISKIPSDDLITRNLDMDILSLIDSNMTEHGKEILLIRLADNTVIRSTGNLGVAEGTEFKAVTGRDGRLKIGDRWYIAASSENSDFRVYALAPDRSVSSKAVLSPVFPALMFALLFLLTILYAWFLREDIRRGRVEQERQNQDGQNLFGMLVRHVRLLFVLIAVCMLALLFVGIAVFVVDNIRVWGYRLLSDIETYYVEEDQNADLVSYARDAGEVRLSDKICYTMDGSAERRTETAIDDLSVALDRDIIAVQNDGTVEVASIRRYDLSELMDPDSDWKPLKSVLDGIADHKSASVEMSGIGYNCWATRRSGRRGMILLMDDQAQQIVLSDYYADFRAPDGLMIFAVNTATGEVLSCSDDSYSGTKAETIGLTEDVLKDGYVGDIMLDGRRCFVQTRLHGERASLITADLSFLAGLYLPVLLKTCAAGFLIVLGAFLLIYLCQKQVWKNLEPELSGVQAEPDSGKAPAPGKESKRGTKAEEEVRKEAEEEYIQEEENASFYREKGGTLHADRGAVSRWLDLKRPFRSLSADEKFRTLIHFGLVAVFVVGFLLYEYRSAEGVKGSTIAYLMQRTWHNGLNVYAVAYAIVVILAIYIVSLVIRKLIVLIGKNAGSRGETIARLISSFIGYAAAIAGVVYSLMYLGVNAVSILASAGIVGLGISIGAKDLVADILAGIAIVFEGEFRTGDIIEINGYRGAVEEIGIRTTKVMALGNVKVFRNSEISGVINLTQRYSIASVKVMVSRAEPLEKVEAIFRRELGRIRRKIPQAVEDISPGGIAEVNPANIVLSFSTKCREADRYSVERTLMREFNLVMEKEHIGSWGYPKVPDGHTPPPSV